MASIALSDSKGGAATNKSKRFPRLSRLKDRQRTLSGHRIPTLVDIGHGDPERSLSQPWLDEHGLAITRGLRGRLIVKAGPQAVVNSVPKVSAINLLSAG